METVRIYKGVKDRHIHAVCWIVLLFLTLCRPLICAQDTLPAIPPLESYLFAGDTVVVAEQDSLSSVLASRFENTTVKEETPFKPNPKKAWKSAAFFPGAGQIYNRQYWKLPIVYGGFMGCAYAITWNNRTYQDYKNAYFSILADGKADPNAEHPENWSDKLDSLRVGKRRSSHPSAQHFLPYQPEKG